MSTWLLPSQATGCLLIFLSLVLSQMQLSMTHHGCKHLVLLRLSAHTNTGTSPLKRHVSILHSAVRSYSMMEGANQAEFHPYYSQFNGQMAFGRRTWNDFVVNTSKEISVKRIHLNHLFWERELLSKLQNFFDNYLAPSLLHPMHALGLPVCDLSKE